MSKYPFYSLGYTLPEPARYVVEVCTNGHIITVMSESDISIEAISEHDTRIVIPKRSHKLCDKCGAPTITNCQNCNSPIKFPATITPPSFCPDCGKPCPWTEAKLKAARELVDEIDNLSPEERNLLKRSLDDIVQDTPQAIVAATRFKKIVDKAGRIAEDGFRALLVDIISYGAKKVIWP